MSLTPEQQRDQDMSEIKIRVIQNAILVKLGTAWLSFPEWTGKAGASAHIEYRIQALYKERRESVRRTVKEVTGEKP